jgi:hypothetical protein
MMEEVSRRNKEIFSLPTYVLYVIRAFSTLEGDDDNDDVNDIDNNDDDADENYDDDDDDGDNKDDIMKMMM